MPPAGGYGIYDVILDHSLFVDQAVGESDWIGTQYPADVRVGAMQGLKNSSVRRLLNFPGFDHRRAVRPGRRGQKPARRRFAKCEANYTRADDQQDLG
jgi:hypothetical protein